MRRTISILSGFALVALGFGAVFTSAAAGSSSTCNAEVVVQVDAWLWARPGFDSYQINLAAPLDEGTWEVGSVSVDEYQGRENWPQDHEQWIVEFLDGLTVVAVAGPTTDLADGVDSAVASDNLGTVVLDQQVDSLRVRHYLTPTEDGTDSVTAKCVGLSFVEPPPPSTSTTVAPPTTVPPTTAAPTTTSSSPTSSSPPATTTTPTLPTSVPPTTPPPPTTASAPPAIARGPIPQLSASVDCRAGTIDATVVNAGDRSTTIDIFLVTESAETGIRLAPGESNSTAFDLPEASEGRVLQLVVSDQVGVADSTQLLIDCRQPAAVEVSIEVRCGADSIGVDLVNRGQEAATVDVLVERSGRIAQVSLDGGGSATVDIDTNGVDSVPLRLVSADGVDILRQSISVDCPRPNLGSTATVSCVSGEILVTVWNQGDASVSFDVVAGRDSVANVDLGPGSVVVVGFPLPEGSTATPLRLLDAGGVDLHHSEVENSCEATPAELQAPCTSVVVANPATGESDLLTVAAPGGPWAANASGTLIEGSDGPSLVADRSCAVPAAEFTVDCPAGAAQVDLSNSGSISSRLLVLVDDRPGDSGFDLAPGTSRSVTLDIDGAREVSVIEAGRAEALAAVSLDCSRGEAGAAASAAQTVLAVSILGTLAAVLVDRRKLRLLVK